MCLDQMYGSADLVWDWLISDRLTHASQVTLPDLLCAGWSREALAGEGRLISVQHAPKKS